MNRAEPGALVAGRYRLHEVVGRGGMGVVWRATDERLRRDVAVKEIIWPSQLGEGEQDKLCQRALREARTAARLNHPGVVRVYDVVEDDGRPWIVMPLVRYPSLSEVVREHGPLPPRRVAWIGVQILDALQAAHAAGVLHRDVKPGNVLLGPEDQVVLTDFGMAIARWQHGADHLRCADRVTGVHVPRTGSRRARHRGGGPVVAGGDAVCGGGGQAPV